MMIKSLCTILLTVGLLTGCACSNDTAVSENSGTAVLCDKVLPITGTFVNLAYQDVRNKYTNPVSSDMTDPLLWQAKVKEMKEFGVEYIVFMAVANEGRAYYPSSLMPWHYPETRTSPVDAIMDAAADCGIKVFMSTGWAVDQDDNLRIPAIKNRQIEMMTELAGLYKNHPALYGWYLPVEDCLGPVLSDYAVNAVNSLSQKARQLTPDKKILISPYGIFNSDFSDPRYADQICSLKVDIIAYQDEIGCVREDYPLTRLRDNWKKLRAVHDRCGIEMWANCESFAWEGNTNDRTSALIPASFSRLLSQQAAATAGGAERIISFMITGIYEPSSSSYRLGQPHWSNVAYDDYMAWKSGDRYWSVVEASLTGRYGPLATEDFRDPRWRFYEADESLIHDMGEETTLKSVLVRMLHSRKDKILPPSSLSLYTSMDGENYTLRQILSCPAFPNDRHDTFVDNVYLDKFEPVPARYVKISFNADSRAAFDRLVINPDLD